MQRVSTAQLQELRDARAIDGDRKDLSLLHDMPTDVLGKVFEFLDPYHDLSKSFAIASKSCRSVFFQAISDPGAAKQLMYFCDRTRLNLFLHVLRKLKRRDAIYKIELTTEADSTSAHNSSSEEDVASLSSGDEMDEEPAVLDVPQLLFPLNRCSAPCVKAENAYGSGWLQEPELDRPVDVVRSWILQAFTQLLDESDGKAELSKTPWVVGLYPPKKVPPEERGTSLLRWGVKRRRETNDGELTRQISLQVGDKKDIPCSVYTRVDAYELHMTIDVGIPFDSGKRFQLGFWFEKTRTDDDDYVEPFDVAEAQKTFRFPAWLAPRTSCDSLSVVPLYPMDEVDFFSGKHYTEAKGARVTR
ncbi:unnamed protein product [Amoebophrya sp. A120]|nr:unnamed protein product [Amoebophrya sp. A120]|eukprot:GSA120T00003119001.1